MKNKLRDYFSLLPIKAVIFFVCLFFNAAYAGPITVTELQQIGFGYTYQGAKTCEVDFDGSLSGDCLGVGTNGDILVEGDPNTSLNVYVTGTNWVNDLKLTPYTIRKYSYVTNGSGQMTFPVSAKLQFRGNPTGVHSLQYTITVNYQ